MSSFHLGVRTADNTYTCPMLSVHLYRHSQFKADMNRKNQTVTVNNNNQQQTHQGPQEEKKEEKSSSEEEVIMVPVEDVLIISSKAEMRKGVHADAKSHVHPVYADSENCCDRCCDDLASCCRKIRDCCCCCCQNQVAPVAQDTTTILVDGDPNRRNSYREEDLPVPKLKEGCCTQFCNRFRCWCCRKRMLVRLIKKTATTAEQEAKRVITITIQYSKYSNLDSATHTRLISDEQRKNHYDSKFKPDEELKFHLVSNTEFDRTNFELRRKEAEILCRTVMQLKGMRNHYPSENELEKILALPYKKTFGDVYDEPELQLRLDPKAAGKKRSSD